MSVTQQTPLLAVDIGNSRMKLGLFETCEKPVDQLPRPIRTCELSTLDEPFDELISWLQPHAIERLSWRLGTVNLLGSTRLIAWLRERDAAGGLMMLARDDLPLEVELERPDMVGVDRLLAAVAVNHLRTAGVPAVIVDLGTAITVDLLSSAGVFRGGAIWPGIAMAARALHEFPDLLPKLDMTSLVEAPTALGTSTVDAMQSGLYWGAIGGVKELIAKLADEVGQTPQVFVTGGAAQAITTLIDPAALCVPDLVLAGIALTSVQ